MERILIMDTYVDNLSMTETVEYVDEFIRNKKPLHLVGVNADKINELQKNSRLKKIINESDIINADGVSVVWAAKVLGMPLKERVAGIDLMYELLKLCQEKKYSVYLLGAKQHIIEKSYANIKKSFPELNIVGYRNGYFKKEEWESVTKQIQETGADIVFIGISSPLKEYLVDYMLHEGGLNSVLMGVGGSFDVVSGVIARAPKWMQKAGLEWFFRFLQEPARLGKRYFLGNLEFIRRVLNKKNHDKLSKRKEL